MPKCLVKKRVIFIPKDLVSNPDATTCYLCGLEHVT